MRKGRPSKYASEEDRREAIRARNRAASKRRKAQRAIAEGRLPGVPGGVRKLSDEERILHRRAAVAKWREKNREYLRERDAASKRLARREKAQRDGRKLQKVGGDPKFTADERIQRRRAGNLDYWRRFPEKRKDLSRKHYVENKDAYCAKAKNRRAKIRAAKGSFSIADIRFLWKLQKGKCVFCLKPLYVGKFHIDHHTPIALGGSNDRSNLRLLHKKCNLEKGARDPVEHAKRNGLLCW